MWIVRFEEEFEREFLALRHDVQDNLLVAARLLADYGPQLARPYADALKGSRHRNMKELRFEAADGPWRVAFAFDPVREGILLVAANKSGMSKSRFYQQLIAKADKRYAAHLARLKAFTKRG
jgi:hypothetical protein